MAARQAPGCHATSRSVTSLAHGRIVSPIHSLGLILSRLVRRCSWSLVVVVVLGIPGVASGQCPEANPTYTDACGPTFVLPGWGDAGGWTDPSQYSTIQLADDADVVRPVGPLPARDGHPPRHDGLVDAAPVDDRAGFAVDVVQAALDDGRPAEGRPQTPVRCRDVAIGGHVHREDQATQCCLPGGLLVPTRRRRQADGGTRTPDPIITSDVLYQLSYVGEGARGGSDELTPGAGRW